MCDLLRCVWLKRVTTQVRYHLDPVVVAGADIAAFTRSMVAIWRSRGKIGSFPRNTW